MNGAEILLWVSFGLLVYIYAGYILILHALTLLIPARHAPDETHKPSVTFLFSAYNERSSLPQKMESLRALSYPRDRIQILVASDASDDGTSEWLMEQPDIEEVILAERSGKNTALNHLLQRAHGEILFFTDANTVLDPECLNAITRHFSDDRVGMVTGQLIFTHDTKWNPVGQGTGLYWRYENSIKQAENRLGSVLVGSGSVLAVRRDLVQPLAPRIANDLELPMRIGAAGYRILFEPECRGYEKPHTDAWEELLRTSRIVSRGLRGFVVLLPLMLTTPFRLWQFVSHKALRWITLPLVLTMLIAAWWVPGVFSSTILAMGMTGGVCSAIGAALILAGRKPLWAKPVTILGHLLLMYTGALWGLVLAMTGRTPAAWSLPTSSR